MRRLTTTWIVFAVLATAGCVDDNGASTDDALPPTGQPFETNATLPGFSLEGCHGTLLRADLPNGWVRPHVPEAFSPSTSLVIGGAVLDIRAVQCDRLINGTSSSGPSHMVFVTIDVTPTNESWIQHGLAGYVIEIISDDPGLNAQARDAGIRALDATFDVTALDPLTGAGFAWSIEGSDFQWQFDYLVYPGEGGGTDLMFDRWYGNETFQRIEVDQQLRFAGYGGVHATDLAVEGNSVVRTLLQDAPTYPVLTQPYVSYDATWRHSATISLEE